jgi:hypothetical protein
VVLALDTSPKVTLNEIDGEDKDKRLFTNYW